VQPLTVQPLTAQPQAQFIAQPQLLIMMMDVMDVMDVMVKTECQVKMA